MKTDGYLVYWINLDHSNFKELFSLIDDWIVANKGLCL